MNDEKNKVFQLEGQQLDLDPVNELLRKGARKLIAQAVEAELEDVMRGYKDRLKDGRASVVRNGYLPERDIQTGLGPVTVRIPKIRAKDGSPVTFRSALVPPYVRKTRSVEAAVPWLYLKGISTGEMAEALRALLGPAASGLSASTVARLKRKWAEEYEGWRNKSLDGERIAYMWADGIYSGLRGREGRLCALVLIGVTERGEKRFLSIEDGERESSVSWKQILLQLKSRGMAAPKLAVGDGAMGFWSALEETYPETRQQRCWVHKTANVLNCLPKTLQSGARRALHDIWQADTRDNSRKAFDVFVKTYEAKYPKAAQNLLKDRQELMTFYDFPAEHWQSIRTTNPIESTFSTIRHRTRLSRGCLSREGILHMMFKLGMCAEKKWRRLRGFKSLGKVITGVNFKDGIEVNEKGIKVSTTDNQAAA